MKTKDKLPDGNYSGLWSGHVVRISYMGKDYQLDTKIGVKGINISCNVQVVNGLIENL